MQSSLDKFNRKLESEIIFDDRSIEGNETETKIKAVKKIYCEIFET